MQQKASDFGLCLNGKGEAAFAATGEELRAIGMRHMTD
jgi:hypothetical protein